MASANARSLRFSPFTPTWLLIQAVVGLTLLGLVVLLSASRTSTYFIKQLSFLGVAVSLGVVMAYLNLEKMRCLAWPIVMASILGLVLTLIIGKEVNGARRWIDLGLIHIQLSEFAKLAMVFGIAHYLALHRRAIQTFKHGFLVPTLIIAVTSGLILLQPDFGNAVLCGVVGGGLLFIAGIRLVYLIPALMTVMSLFATAVIIDPGRLRRITAFLDLEAHKMDGAYQLYQAILAFGAGGVGGVGLGKGRQQLAFLPEAHTDFIFPVIGEELGFCFTVGVIVLFLVIFLTGLVALHRAHNLFYLLLALGALLLITVQALINIGVTTGCLPTKGLSLPFISYGGSNLVLMFMLIGILVNCLRLRSKRLIRKPREL